MEDYRVELSRLDFRFDPSLAISETFLLYPRHITSVATHGEYLYLFDAPGLFLLCVEQMH